MAIKYDLGTVPPDLELFHEYVERRDKERRKLRVKKMGSAKSGHWGHVSVPGKRGGSAPGPGGGKTGKGREKYKTPPGLKAGAKENNPDLNPRLMERSDFETREAYDNYNANFTDYANGYDQDKALKEGVGHLKPGDVKNIVDQGLKAGGDYVTPRITPMDKKEKDQVANELKAVDQEIKKNLGVDDYEDIDLQKQSKEVADLGKKQEQLNFKIINPDFNLDFTYEE